MQNQEKPLFPAQLLSPDFILNKSDVDTILSSTTRYQLMEEKYAITAEQKRELAEHPDKYIIFDSIEGICYRINMDITFVQLIHWIMRTHFRQGEAFAEKEFKSRFNRFFFSNH